MQREATNSCCSGLGPLNSLTQETFPVHRLRWLRWKPFFYQKYISLHVKNSL